MSDTPQNPSADHEPIETPESAQARLDRERDSRRDSTAGRRRVTDSAAGRGCDATNGAWNPDERAWNPDERWAPAPPASPARSRNIGIVAALAIGALVGGVRRRSHRLVARLDPVSALGEWRGHQPPDDHRQRRIQRHQRHRRRREGRAVGRHRVGGRQSPQPEPAPASSSAPTATSSRTPTWSPWTANPTTPRSRCRPTTATCTARSWWAPTRSPTSP